MYTDIHTLYTCTFKLFYIVHIPHIKFFKGEYFHELQIITTNNNQNDIFLYFKHVAQDVMGLYTLGNVEDYEKLLSNQILA